MMDDILLSAQAFVGILNIRYRFVVSKSRQIREIVLDFDRKDYYHFSGLQHLTDISIPSNRKKTIDNIISGKITDAMLKQSKYYNGSLNSEIDISSRIHESQFIEQYLDHDNYIRIFTTRNNKIGSFINAEYVIESCLGVDMPTVYIFLRRRSNKSTYCIVSFFAKGGLMYSGETLYWMLKQKIYGDVVIELYRHKDYKYR